MNMDIDAIHINIPRGIDLVFFSVLIVLISYTPFHLDFELLVPMLCMGTRFVSWLLPPIDTFEGRHSRAGFLPLTSCFLLLTYCGMFCKHQSWSFRQPFLRTDRHSRRFECPHQHLLQLLDHYLSGSCSAGHDMMRTAPYCPPLKGRLYLRHP